MQAQATDRPTLSRLPAHLAPDVLEGLARLHQTVAVLDASARIVWLKDSAGTLLDLVPGPASEGSEGLGALLELSHYASLCAQLRARGLVVDERVELLLPGGRTLPVALSLTRLGAGDDSSHTVALLHPIGERERRDRTLRQTVEYLGSILGAAPHGVLAVDSDGFVTYANPATERLLGFAREEVVDKPVSVFFRSGGDLERLAKILRRQTEDLSEDMELRRKDEGSLRAAVSANALRLPDGAHVGAVLVLQDVTGRRRVEDELRRKNAELEHYVHTVSHDLRSPLVALLGFTRLLREDYGDRLDDRGRHFVDRLEQAGRSMEALTHDLLELSRIGERNDRKALVDPRRVLEIVQSEVKPRLEEGRVALGLPESPPLVLCDRTRLYQVFSNLIGNALDYMGDVAEPRIDVEVTEDAAFHLISVRDNGRGVAPELQERIFEIFQSLGPRRDGRRGTGVGLAIVRKIAETHGGRVWVESRPGEGARFVLALPRP